MTVSSGNETLTIDEGQIAFIERNIQINVSIKKSDSINPFEIISLDRNLLLSIIRIMGNDSNLLIVFYVQIMPDDLVMQLHRF
ncbi:VirF [Shigella flexneri 2a]|nr:VirF [Shigella flexneri 2a]